MALLAVRDCEKELDRIERQIDDELPKASRRSAKMRLASFSLVSVSLSISSASATSPGVSRTASSNLLLACRATMPAISSR